ncbi:hypothetical protein RB9736 [Rhodopirellula baltica SH 1]|uniref:Uncharacterized protein n=1 Tax=Rhodopirellula baltica (strain DSM 10527 / NCIMB 13988 / SH1) TaxID=243090 RepID=Q7UL51_RHOBA|nr:hypothetical protein RB9736 [Rhodopirellula baltica SH 1]
MRASERLAYVRFYPIIPADLPSLVGVRLGSSRRNRG